MPTKTFWSDENPSLMKFSAINVSLLFILFVLMSCAIYPVKNASTVAPSTWGGEHLMLTISASGAALEFDCAAGQIGQPIAVDKNGNFDMAGTFTPQHGGPIRKDESAPAQPARYSGHVARDTMTLNVVRDQQEIGKFTLTRGARPKLTRCL